MDPSNTLKSRIEMEAMEDGIIIEHFGVLHILERPGNRPFIWFHARIHIQKDRVSHVPGFNSMDKIIHNLIKEYDIKPMRVE